MSYLKCKSAVLRSLNLLYCILYTGHLLFPLANQTRRNAKECFEENSKVQYLIRIREINDKHDAANLKIRP